MKTCRDCIHGDVCPHKILPIDIHPSYIDFSVRDDVENSCKDFKDKTRVIELPCSIGDTVYIIRYDKIYNGKVNCIRPFVFWDRIEYRGNATVSIPDPFYNGEKILNQEYFIIFGYDAFLTEEAEKNKDKWVAFYASDEVLEV